MEHEKYVEQMKRDIDRQEAMKNDRKAAEDVRRAAQGLRPTGEIQPNN